MQNSVCECFHEVGKRDKNLIKLEITRRVSIVHKILNLLDVLKRLKNGTPCQDQKSKNNNLVSKAESKIALRYLVDSELLESLAVELEAAIEDAEKHLKPADKVLCLALCQQVNKLSGRVNSDGVQRGL